ncbi:MAG: class I SAM-dependent methyltransferase [archaeon]
MNTHELNVARKDAEKQKVEVSFKKANMLDLDYDCKFDCAINMWYSFGFFEKDSENLKVLKNFYNSLRKGGKFLMHTDVNMPRVFAGKFREYEKRSLGGGGFMRQIEFYSPETKRNHGVWVLEKNGKVEMKDYSVRVYTKEEFEGMCKEVGFSKVEIYSDWNGSKYSPDSEDMIVVAIK